MVFLFLPFTKPMIMRILLLLVLMSAAIWNFSSCNSGSGQALFCDTACITDTMMFRNSSHELKPYIYISADDCIPDTIGRGYIGSGVSRKMRFADLIDNPMLRINPSKVLGFAGDTSFAYLLFNDCITGRGFAIKLSYGENGQSSVRSSAINKHDPKFDVADGIYAYTDRGNIFVEDMTTGKEAMMTFGQKLDIDYDAIHEYIDSVHITRDRIWARLMIGKKWEVREKPIEL